ncbi:hypothetical protein PHSC3_001506 [Chlamydiales bacterium STE3]|nr:hypothetical protein PHSC3_001506 [Chlamydiales bacterium STE3]
MIPRDLTFLHPEFASLFLALPFFGLLFIFSERKRKQSLRKLSAFSLDQIAILPTTQYLLFKMLCFWVFWIFASLALMRPVGNEHYVNKNVKALSSQDVIFLIDSSASMAVTDTATNVSRFAYAKEIVDLVIQRLKGNDIMLVTFANGTSLVAPQTHDALFLRIRLKDLQMNEDGISPGTDYKSALSELKRLYFFDPQSAFQTLIILSDGGDTELEGLGNEKRVEGAAVIVDAVNKHLFPHLKIYGIGIGTDTGGEVPGGLYNGKKVLSKLEPLLLESLSKKTGGAYFNARDYSPEDLADLLVQKINEHQGEGKGAKEIALRAYNEYFQIPLFLSILALLLFMFFPISASSKTLATFLLFLFPFISEASEDFLARQFFEARVYPESAQIYQAMLKKAPASLHPLIAYNLGTIALAERKFEEAIDFLEDIQFANELSPKARMRALFNLAIAYRELAIAIKDPLKEIYFLKKAFDTLFPFVGHLETEIQSSDLLVIKKSLSEKIQALNSSLIKGIDEIVLLWEAAFFFNSRSNIAMNGLSDDRASKPVLVEAERSWQKGDTIKSHRLAKQLQEQLVEWIYQSYNPFLKWTLLEDLQKLYLLNGAKDLIAVFQSRAALLFPNNEQLLQGEQDLQNSRLWEKKGNRALAESFFLDASFALEQLVISQQRQPVIRAFNYLIARGQFLLKKERLRLRYPAESVLIPSIIQENEQILQESKKLPKVIYAWQILRFNEGICQCNPWNAVFPLLDQADQKWKEASSQSPSYANLVKRKEAVAKWQEALEIVKEKPEGPQKEQRSRQLLNELQEMELLDRVPRKSAPLPPGEKFW